MVATHFLLQREAHGLDDLPCGDVTVLLDHVVFKAVYFRACNGRSRRSYRCPERRFPKERDAPPPLTMSASYACVVARALQTFGDLAGHVRERGSTNLRDVNTAVSRGRRWRWRGSTHVATMTDL